MYYLCMHTYVCRILTVFHQVSICNATCYCVAASFVLRLVHYVTIFASWSAIDLLYKMYKVIIFFSYSFVNCRRVEYSTVRNISKILNTVFLYLLSSWSQMIISGSYTFSDIYQYVCIRMLHVHGRHYTVIMCM